MAQKILTQSLAALFVSIFLVSHCGSAWADEGAEASSISLSNGPSEAITLSEAVGRALGQGFLAQIARLETGQAEEEALELRGAYLPQLLIDAQAGWTNRINETMVAGDGKVYGLDNLGNEPWIDVFVQQALVDLRLWNLIEREHLAADLAEIAETQVREGVAFEVTRQYANLVRIERLLEGAKGQYADALWLEDKAQSRAEVGRTLGLEHEDAALYREETELLIETLELERTESRAALKISLGYPNAAADWPQVIPGSLPVPSGTTFPEGVERALEKTPEVRSLEIRRQMEEASVSAAEAERWPTLQLRGGYANYGIKRYDEFKDAGYVFVGMEIPIFDGLQTKHSIAGARKTAEIARLRYRSALAQKRFRVAGLIRKLETATRRAQLAGRRDESSRAQQSHADLQLQAQRGELSSALSARRRSAADSAAAIDRQFDELEVWAQLKKEMGSLALGLAPDSILLNPAQQP